MAQGLITISVDRRSSVIDLIGNTPLLRLARIAPDLAPGEGSITVSGTGSVAFVPDVAELQSPRRWWMRSTRITGSDEILVSGTDPG